MIDSLLQENKVTVLDLKLAQIIAKGEHNSIFYLSLLLSINLRRQHTCLPLRRVNWQNPFYLSPAWTPFTSFETAIEQLKEQLLNDENIPLKLHGERLYFARYDRYEQNLVDHFSRLIDSTTSVNRELLQQLLMQQFGNDEQLNWQKVACCSAVLNKLSIISGGPGTGKTTTVAKLLVILQSLYAKTPLSIALVAPTGKAAARLSESLQGAKLKLNTTDTVLQSIPDTAQTIHRLLGVIPHSNKFRHNKEKQLKLDLLVIDEASMIDLALMSKLFDALPDHARVVMLGDKDQLSSVDTGNILADICTDLKLGRDHRYSHLMQQELLSLCQIADVNSIRTADTTYKLNDNLAFLQFSHRFSATSGIGKFAKAVNFNDIGLLQRIIEQGESELTFYDINQSYRDLIERSADAYQHYLFAIQTGANVPEVHKAFASYQLLAAVKKGPFGVAYLNSEIEKTLARRGAINITDRHYVGKPIMIMQNDYQLGLFNGDIGILMTDDSGQIVAAFIDEHGESKSFSPARLPLNESVYAMTIHKSQGSEFDHVAMILPPENQSQQGINRQLVYTGITRAKKKFDLYAQYQVLTAAMAKNNERFSGLYERMSQPDK